MGKYYYEVVFSDGRYIRREYVSKKLAESVYNTMVYEMVALGVKEASWGLVK